MLMFTTKFTTKYWESDGVVNVEVSLSFASSFEGGQTGRGKPPSGSRFRPVQVLKLKLKLTSILSILRGARRFPAGGTREFGSNIRARQGERKSHHWVFVLVRSGGVFLVPHGLVPLSISVRLPGKNQACLSTFVEVCTRRT